jgi:membrane glycosyltransferase
MTEKRARYTNGDTAADRADARERPLEVPAARLLQDWKEAHARAVAYLAALGVPAGERQAVATEAAVRALADEHWDGEGDAVAATSSALRAVLIERYPKAPRPWDDALDAFAAWRLDALLAARFAEDRPPPPAAPPEWRGRFAAMPPLMRGAMVPERIPRGLFRRLFGRGRRARAAGGAGAPAGEAVTPARQHAHAHAQRGRALRAARRRLPWIKVAHRRRFLLMVLVLIPSIIASGFMVNVLPAQGGTWLEVTIVFFFGALFGWISIGFWTAVLGFATLVGRRDRFAITNVEAGDGRPLDPAARTAIVMPICEEPVERVFAGLKAIHRSLERAGALEHFHFFVLSDSGDPSTWVREEEAWAAWCRETGGFDRIFYRRRRVHLRRKSGNIADFCRRWGRRYRYMIMLDADSVMAGGTLVRLVEMMERRPDAGMIQTAPTAVNRRSLLARAQQFAARMYGPMFAAGLHYWQLGDGQYWGHNAIIRIEPFMAHCALPRLPGKPPLGGEILSHDFVEAALMGRAGWTLWLAFDLDGSYEEMPSTLLEEMRRDRRWCQGNLQHLRLLPTEGLFGAHRALFLNGVLSYVSALLWFTFLTLSTAEAISNALASPDYFPHGASLFPQWPVWRPDWALALLAVTAMILFLPKILSILLVVFRGRNAHAFGGLARMVASVGLEILLSSLLAPIRMVFHSRFVLTNLLGRTVTWGPQGRQDAETSWREAIRYHGLDTLFASAWGISLFWLNPNYFWWIMPIIGALILSVPLSVHASRVSLGDRARALGLFVIPEESDPPIELRDLDALLHAGGNVIGVRPETERNGFVRAAVDPSVNALHRALLGARRSLAPAIRAARTALLERVLAEGPGALATRERRVLLTDPDLVDEIHRRLWALPSRARAARWGRPGMGPGEGG